MKACFLYRVIVLLFWGNSYMAFPQPLGTTIILNKRYTNLRKCGLLSFDRRYTGDSCSKPAEKTANPPIDHPSERIGHCLLGES
jgi:hypothetical protein